MPETIEILIESTREKNQEIGLSNYLLNMAKEKKDRKQKQK